MKTENSLGILATIFCCTQKSMKGGKIKDGKKWVSFSQKETTMVEKKRSNWIAWVAVLALILAVVAVAVVLKGSVTGEVIKVKPTLTGQQVYTKTEIDAMLPQNSGNISWRCSNRVFFNMVPPFNNGFAYCKSVNYTDFCVVQSYTVMEQYTNLSTGVKGTLSNSGGCGGKTNLLYFNSFASVKSCDFPLTQTHLQTNCTSPSTGMAQDVGDGAIICCQKFYS